MKTEMSVRYSIWIWQRNDPADQMYGRIEQKISTYNRRNRCMGYGMKKKKNIETGKTIQKSYVWEFCMVFCIMLMLPINISLMFGQQAQDQKEEVEETEEETKKKILESELEWEVLHQLARTIPIDYELETLKAQAVILRTNILADREEGKGERNAGSASGFTSAKADRENQKENGPILLYAYKERWGGSYEKNCEKLCDAVTQTSGMYLEKKRRPIRASYFRLSNGSTRDAKECLSENYPEYAAVECRKDLMSHEFLNKTELEGTEFAAGVNSITGQHFSYAQLRQTEIAYQEDSAGYVLKVIIGGTEIGGEIFRKYFLLPSSDFFVILEEQNVCIETKGIGTGFGFCQYGANEMAKEGEDFLNLLNYFFTNIAISKTE